MLINTKFLGQIEIEEHAIISFKNGLPGFPEIHRFVLLTMEENPSLYYFQSIEQEPLCFIVTSPFAIIEDYEADVSEETVEELEIKNPEDVNLYVILTIKADAKNITANLLAPLVINNSNNKATQEILNGEKYSVRHKLF